MRVLLFLLAVVLAAAAIKIPLPIKVPGIDLPGLLKDLTPEKKTDLFGKFAKNFGKKYDNDTQKGDALKKFGKNLEKIIDLNSKFGGKKIKFGLNQFSDLTDDEFKQQVLMKELFDKSAFASHKRNHSMFLAETNLQEGAPDEFDWRDTPNVVSGIKNQGNCGCCWAFATAGVVTGAYGLKNNKLVEPSEQQICDCAGTNGKPGCGGGYVGNGLAYARDKGISPTTGYTAYTPTRSTVTGVCAAAGKANNLKISYYELLEDSNADYIKDILYVNGPVAASYAVGPSFRHYESGVFSNDDCSSPEGWHAVLIVGYGSEDGEDYWLVKNSWGTSFGESGYFRMARGYDLCQFESARPFFANG